MIPIPLLGGIIEAVGKVAGDLITTDKERLAAQHETDKLTVGLLQGQIETNKIEASSASLFTSGWRPFIGWICGIALGLVYIPKSIVLTVIWTYQAWTIVSAWHGIGVMQPLPAYPDLGVTDLIGLLASLLGMAALRSADKAKGVSS